MTSLRSALRRLNPHRRVMGLMLLLACAGFLFVRPDLWGLSIGLLLLAIFFLLIASQLFWVDRLLDLAERFLPGKPRRGWLGLVLIIGGFLWVFWARARLY